MKTMLLLLGVMLAPAAAAAQATNPLWHEQKIKNYLPHMSWTEVQDLRTRTDMVIIPIAALEQHAHHLPIGTDFLNGLERARLVAQKTDVLAAPILLPGNSPYHMEFPGTITLSSQTIQQVYFEAAQSLMKHGFSASCSSTAIAAITSSRSTSPTASIRRRKESRSISAKAHRRFSRVRRSRRGPPRASSTGMAASAKHRRRCMRRRIS
jgi:hypothetical protein